MISGDCRSNHTTYGYTVCKFLYVNSIFFVLQIENRHNVFKLMFYMYTWWCFIVNVCRGVCEIPVQIITVKSGCV